LRTDINLAAAQVDGAFQQFLHGAGNSSVHERNNRSLWIDARAQRVDSSDRWRWVDGRQSG